MRRSRLATDEPPAPTDWPDETSDASDAPGRSTIAEATPAPKRKRRRTDRGAVAVAVDDMDAADHRPLTKRTAPPRPGGRAGG